MEERELFAGIEKILSDNSFKKKSKLLWNKSVDEKWKWVIEFQKGKRASKGQFDMTINVGVYLMGTERLLYEKESEFANSTICFFSARPYFFGNLSSWWDFDMGGDNSAQIADIEQSLQCKIIPFLNGHRTFDSLLENLPIKKWESNTNFHSELLRIGVGYYLLNRLTEAKSILQQVIDGGTIWGEKAKKVMDQIGCEPV